MVEALMKSKNTAAVWTLSQLGIDMSKSYLEKMGIDISDKGLAIALGGLEKEFLHYRSLEPFIHLQMKAYIKSLSLFKNHQ